MLLKATFNNISVISWRLVLLVEETEENYRPAASHWLILSHNIVSSTPRLGGIRTDCIGSCKSNYHTTTTTPQWNYDDDVYDWFVLNQHALLDFYCASLLKQRGTHVAALVWTHYPDFEPSSLFSYPLKLHAKRRNSKYYFLILVSPDRGSNPRFTALEANALVITPIETVDTCFNGSLCGM